MKLGAGICALASLNAAVWAQSFSIVKIIDSNTPRPDGQGIFQNPHTPSTDGKYVVWTEQAGDYSIWSADLTTSRLTRLADTTTAVPGGTGNFSNPFSQLGGGPYAGFSIIVRNGTAVFQGNDSTGNGLYSVPAAGGAITRIVNYNVSLPGGGRFGTPGNQVYAFGVNDSGSVVLTGGAGGFAPDGTAVGGAVYSASIDGSNLALIADEDHLFINPLQPAGPANSCSQVFGTVAIGGNTVVFSGSANSFGTLYSLPVGGPAQGVPPSACNRGPAGPLVVQPGTPFPGDPAARPVPLWDFLQTDGANVYVHGYDDTTRATWTGGIFSIPLSGGTWTKIVEVGDTLPAIGKATTIGTQFSVDNGGVVFIASNDSGTNTLRGIFLYQNGQISKIFASGDSLNGGVLGPNGNLEIWPQAYKNGRIAFGWLGGIYIASSGSSSGAPSISSGGVVTLNGTSSTLQPGSWASIFGSNLIAGQIPVTWNGDYPTNLGGTTVTINGKPGYLSYASPAQLNFQTPDDSTRGPVTVTVTTPTGSASGTATLADQSPSFSVLGDGKHVAGIIVRTDGSGAYGNGTYDIIGPAGASLGFKTAPAKAGDSVVLFGVGFGPTTPPVPAGKVFSGASPANDTIAITVNNTPVTAFFSGVSTPGLFQFNITLPPGLGSGDQPLRATVNGVSTQAGIVVALQ